MRKAKQLEQYATAFWERILFVVIVFGWKMKRLRAWEMPLDIFSDYIQDNTGQEFPWECIVSIFNGNGYGIENGYGIGYGIVYGYGYRNGNGIGYGNGYGFGNGIGNGNGFGNGIGNGNGIGYGRYGNGNNHQGDG